MQNDQNFIHTYMYYVIEINPYFNFNNFN